MDFHQVTDPNTGEVHWEGHNLAEGYSVNVRLCTDGSGYIARIVDLFTGELLHQMYGSTAMILWNSAVAYMNKHSVYVEFAFA